MVRRHLTAVNRIHIAHFLFDKRMAGFTLYRFASAIANKFEGIPKQSRVVHNLSTGIASQQRLRQKTDNVVPFNEISIAIKEKASVKVAIPRNASLRFMRDNGVNRRTAVFR